MSVIYIALPIALGLAAAAVWGFMYCVRDGQFDDLETPPMRVLFDDLAAKRPDQSTRPATSSNGADRE